MRECTAARASVIIALQLFAKVHPNASSADDERLRCRVGDDVVGEIDSFSRDRGKMKSLSATGRTLVPRDGACSRRILVIIARRAAWNAIWIAWPLRGDANDDDGVMPVAGCH